MRTMSVLLEAGARSLSAVLGIVVAALVVAVIATSLSPTEIADWALEIFGISFLVLLGGLLFVAAFAGVRMWQWHEDPRQRVFWRDVGLQASSGIATLALTYTLLGISLGVGALAEHALTPETVHAVIRELSRHFSLALLSTVIGLPVSTATRSALMIAEGRIDIRMEIDRKAAKGETS
jgi:protein-S-isoprenylcysteine O-methyltransferase Ste14